MRRVSDVKFKLLTFVQQLHIINQPIIIELMLLRHFQ